MMHSGVISLGNYGDNVQRIVQNAWQCHEADVMLVHGKRGGTYIFAIMLHLNLRHSLFLLKLSHF